MEYYRNTLCCTYGELMAAGVSASAYDHMVQRGDLRVMRRGCRGREALVAYAGMPERVRRMVEAMVGDPYAAASRCLLAEYLTDRAEVADYLDNFRTHSGRLLPDVKRREYYANAMVLEAIDRMMQAARGIRVAQGGSNVRPAAAGRHTRTARFESVVEMISRLDQRQWPHKLPQNPRSLDRLLRRYKAEGPSALVHKFYTEPNVSAAKLQTDDQKAMLATIAGSGNNLDNVQIADIYNRIATQMGWPTIGDRTVGAWRSRLEADLCARRFGTKAWANTVAMQVRRRAPEWPLQYWTLDGWDVELAFRDKRPGKATTYTNRVTMVVVLDACCKYPIGYAVGLHETPALIREALRVAHRHTESLFGQMMRAQQIQSDNYAIKTLSPLYGVSARLVTPAAVGNAKAKIIEPWFKYFNKKYCQLQTNWTGFGVTSRRELQPNAEALAARRASFPDFDGVCAQVVAMLEQERAELRERYLKAWDAMPTERRLPLSMPDYLTAYGETTGRTNLLRGSGITMQIDGRVYEYDSFDPEMRRHLSTPWHVLYDPEDMRHVVAVNDDGTLRFEMEERYVQPMALVDRTPADTLALERVRAFNRRLREQTAARLDEWTGTATALLEGRKSLEMAQKFLIPDSRGRHKDARNEAREMLSDLPDEWDAMPQTKPRRHKATEADADDDVLSDF